MRDGQTERKKRHIRHSDDTTSAKKRGRRNRSRLEYKIWNKNWMEIKTESETGIGVETKEIVLNKTRLEFRSRTEAKPTVELEFNSRTTGLLSPRKPTPDCLSSRAHASVCGGGFLAVWRRLMMDSVFFQTSLFSRALQCDGWLATVSDAPLSCIL
ncbi:hypothetical protein EVAR_95886_1 [Eumeta japonica]|uniref:Uncharacterized protein n=1 Tax=Eumeta variegata TaxID=151549 RepID=A0A4C2ADG2_EUMVA|nr:hypothetical protein EVAR_95886_1 [Eumeta japonica]